MSLQKNCIVCEISDTTPGSYLDYCYTCRTGICNKCGDIKVKTLDILRGYNFCSFKCLFNCRINSLFNIYESASKQNIAIIEHQQNTFNDLRQLHLQKIMIIMKNNFFVRDINKIIVEYIYYN